MRFSRFIAVLVMAMAVTTVQADDKKQTESERERRVRVAMTMASAKTTLDTSTGAIEECCFHDYETAHTEAMKADKPLVVFVGTACGDRGCRVADLCVPLLLSTYLGDGNKTPMASRVVVLTKGGGTAETGADVHAMYVRKVLTGDVAVEVIKTAIVDAVAKPKASTAEEGGIDWLGGGRDSGDEDDVDTSEPIGYVRGAPVRAAASACQNGRCEVSTALPVKEASPAVPADQAKVITSAAPVTTFFTFSSSSEEGPQVSRGQARREARAARGGLLARFFSLFRPR